MKANTDKEPKKPKFYVPNLQGHKDVGSLIESKWQPQPANTDSLEYDYIENLEHDFGFSKKEMAGIRRAYLQLLERVEKEIVGEDEKLEHPNDLDNALAASQNVLREEQRKALDTLRGELDHA